MPQPAYRDSRYYSSNLTGYREDYGRYTALQNCENVVYAGNRTYYIHPECNTIKPNQKKIKRNFFIQRVISFVFFALVATFIIPAMFNKFVTAIPSGSRYAHITADYEKIVHPIEAYLANDLSLGIRTIQGANVKHPKMLPLKENKEMGVLHNRIVALQKE